VEQGCCLEGDQMSSMENEVLDCSEIGGRLHRN
jgi:hypothetical protein